MLVALTALGGLGLAVGEWRRTHPDPTARLERFDLGARGESADAPPALTTTAPTPAPAARAARDERRPTPSAVESAARPTKRRPEEGRLDLNRATVEDLRRLPGIGPALAERIATARARTGHFTSVDDLESVPGVGTVRLARLREYVTVAR
jgi:competence protein ComEA